MASYDLLFKKSVAKDLRQLPKADVKRILQRIRSLAVEPRPLGCEKLSGQERYRVRQGAYRIVYQIDAHVLIVLVVKVGHRRDVYRN
jgi:mRNA interferase RelE/StbE